MVCSLLIWRFLKLTTYLKQIASNIFSYNLCISPSFSPFSSNSPYINFENSFFIMILREESSKNTSRIFLNCFYIKNNRESIFNFLSKDKVVFLVFVSFHKYSLLKMMHVIQVSQVIQSNAALEFIRRNRLSS